MTVQSVVPDKAEVIELGQADSGLFAVAAIAGHFRIAADPRQLQHELGLQGRAATPDDLRRAANRLDLKARWISDAKPKRLTAVPLPAIIGIRERGFFLLAQGSKKEQFRLLDPVRRTGIELGLDELVGQWNGTIILVTRKIGGAGADPRTFGFSWFLPSIWRYRRPLSHVLVASFFVQLFGLITPLFFQLVIDKVLIHKGYATLIVLIVGMVIIGLFESFLTYLRSYVLNHTTNRMDVELGRRLFYHLFRLPIAYFETRPTGQTVARVRELETIRNFLTGQGLTSLLDLFFTFIFIAVMFLYSTTLALVVIATVPVYILIASSIRPILRERIQEKFNRGAQSQQFLVESIVGAQTLKASSVEPLMQVQWEERLAAYVKTSFSATMLGALGQNLIQYVTKLTTAFILFFGAQAVIEGTMTVGELIAFNMIAAQLIQPVLRLSQLWQDFQQVQVSVERLGDILNSPVEPIPPNLPTLGPPKGAIELRDVTFRYQPGRQEVIRDLSLSIKPGEVIGIVGPSGSGKSTLTKLIQRLYSPERGQLFLDGVDVAQLDPRWLRRQIGVVLQENVLFNCSIHDNIALTNPAMSRSQVMHVARLGGADEFIATLPQGYDTIIEERGANLSGGQRQRIAIARALATNPRILILDEATSALDYESERIIQNNMSAIVKDRTVIVIAHRLAAVRPCNRIIGIADGRLIEQGTHEQLIDMPGGLYAHLWSLQNNWTKS
ncbi:type I secretion system permease/ATPase [Bradyrhizobium jicamae]|uniref:Type I secretion system permease/ATPase n=1 Tax=Bradyrhizobium jicamae TaxID=280332 RepID=A0ABS5FUP8_9BRAD|nr:type I secretion system permease/ATPase [Bradyrhizobium jicamae]MBR0800502.1 type I secretion system permease/ATPase [Bradyrhizobium jicamae]